MPVSSLPSPYGIGTFGREAYIFVDRLVDAGQRYWQVLPLGATSYGDSPYASFSAFAGNPYFIDLDYLINEQLISTDLVSGCKWGDKDDSVDYAAVFNSRFMVLHEAYNNSSHKKLPSYDKFLADSRYWLDDYALYMACKTYFDNVSWQEWDDDIRFRKPEAVKKYTELLKDEIDFWKFVQYKFFEQWTWLKTYAEDRGIKIIGDIPIYVAYDSADVWSHTGLFQLDEEMCPKKVAGVPPDAFSDLGQRWGNPLYDWDAIEDAGFEWWKERMKASAALYDIIRIDHFIGIARYYTIPAEDEDARNGEWVTGPGRKLIDAINSVLGDKKIIAEDLGVLVPEAVNLLKYSGYPGMNVLEFAFDGSPDNEHLPHNYSANSVTYGGTHDNETLKGFFASKEEWELKYARDYLQAWNDNIDGLIDKIFALAYQSVSDVVVFQMQDVLKLDNEARMNLPSTVGTNWLWRMRQGQFSPDKTGRLRYLTDIYGR